MTETTAASVKADTRYRVLRRTDGEEKSLPTWEEVAALEARSAEHAIKQYAEKSGSNKPELVLVAIPSRSWQPMKVVVKTETRLEVSAA